MKIFQATSLISLFLMGCTTMEQHWPNATKTSVDGEEYMVRQISEGTYQAVPNNPGLKMTVDARIWAKNIKAIEQVTGCTVIAGSTRNNDSNTVAAVDCKKVERGQG